MLWKILNQSKIKHMSSDKTPVSKSSSRLARFFGLGGRGDKAEPVEEVAEAEAEELDRKEPEGESQGELPEEPQEHLIKEQLQESPTEDPQQNPEPSSGSGEPPTSSNEPLAEQVAAVEMPEQTSDREDFEPKIKQQVEEKQQKKGLLARWRAGLGKTRQGLGSAFGALLSGRYKIDEDLIEEIETLLLTADVGIDTTAHLIELFRDKVKKEGTNADKDLMQLFRGLLVELLENHQQPLQVSGRNPDVIMMVGVNGVGKTTSIGKLAKRLQSQGKSVILAAGDTFRAAAVEQLQVWGERNQVPVVAQKTGSDSASVVYDALHSAQARGVDVLIADTAGRLHNKSNLMEELGKVVRVLKKLDDSAPHEILLVLDAATGQNALSQAREFCKTVPVTGLILTKLDGTAKGGVAFSLVQQLQLPVKFVGLGEGIDDLTEFNPVQFVDALFDSDSSP